MEQAIAQTDVDISKLEVVPAPQITVADTHVDKDTGTVQFNDTAAIKLVLDNAELADNFININQWASGWTMADLLYQSPMSTSNFEQGTDVANSAVPKFMVSNHISAIIPKVMGGIFYEDPCFLLRPSPGTSTEIIDAKTAIFQFQLKAMRFEEEIERGLEQMALLGTGIWKWGYAEYKKKIKKYKRLAEKKAVPTGTGDSVILVDTPESDDFDIEFKEQLVSHPWLSWCDLRTILVDPGLRVGDIRKAKWVIHRDYATFADLNKLRGLEGYMIPEETLLREMFSKATSPGPDNITMTIPEGMMGYLQHAKPRSYKTSADPNQAPLELLEYWDNEKVIVVLIYNGHNIMLRNEANPFGKIPFFSANWRNIPDNFYGQGLGMLIGSEQIVEQGVTNLALDLLAYCLQPVALRKKGMNALSQNMRWEQGGIIDVEDDVTKAFQFLQMPTPPEAAFRFIEQSQVSGASTSGANEQVVQGAGHMGASSTGMRSGTGAAGVIAANASRLDGPTGRFVRQVFEPWLHQMDELDNDLLPTSVIRDVLGKEAGQKFMDLDHVEYRGSEVKYEVLAGANLGAKKEMAQFFPFITNLMANPVFVQNCSQAGYIFDGPAIFKAFSEAAGWKYSQSFLRLMTGDERKKFEANQPGAIAQAQNQNAQDMQQRQFDHDQTMENQKQAGKAGNEAFRASMEKALNSELGDSDRPQGFGATTSL